MVRSHDDTGGGDFELSRAGGSGWMPDGGEGGGRGEWRQSDQRGGALPPGDRERRVADRIRRRDRAQAMAAAARGGGVPGWGCSGGLAGGSHGRLMGMFAGILSHGVG